MLEKNVWDILLKELNNEYGVAGMMGNIYAESGMIANRVEILCLKRLKENGQNWTDTTYTAAVDSGKISRATFLNPLPGKQYGYGLCQWTSPGRKAGLYDLAKSNEKSIGDESIQIQWLLTELKKSYSSVLNVLKNATSVQQASDAVLIHFEAPNGITASTKNLRASYGMNYYNKYHKAATSSNSATISKSKYDKYIYSSGTHYISNSGSDENGGYHGGKAGDQTGNEWCLRSWYSRPWNCVLRYEKDPKVGIKLAELGCAAALNDLIGYDQYERDTYWQHLKASNYDPAQITIACEGDCSAGVIANTKAAGILLGIKALQNINATYTGNMRQAYKNAGFTVLTDSKYTNSTEYLLPGDILLNDLHHVATNVTTGSKASKTTTPTTNTSSSNGNTSYCGKGIGTATSLCEMNIRSGAGTNYSSYGSIKKGTSVEVLEKTSNNWYKIVWPGASCGFAYTSATDAGYYKYVVKKKETTAIKSSNVASKSADYINKAYAGVYTVNAGSDVLNVRDGAGTNNKVLVAIPTGTKVNNYGYYSKSGSTIWLYIQFNYKNVTYTGFASKDYLKK